MWFIDEIAHPTLLGILLILNIPVFVAFARTVYRDPDQLAEEVKRVGEVGFGRGRLMNEDNYPRVLGAIFFILVCASAVKIEYMFISWVLE